MKDIKLPPLDKYDHPEPRSFFWTQEEIRAIQAYARAAVELNCSVPDVEGDMLTIAYMQGYQKGKDSMLAFAPTAQPADRKPCNACNGTGRMPRDPDIGTDQECFVCAGTGIGD